MNKKSAILFTCRLLFFLAFTFVPDLSGSAQSIIAAPGPNAYDLVDAVNSFRATHGLSSYRTNSILMQIAQAQADYLASSGGAYGHTGPGGTRPYQRALAAGYPVANALTNPPGWFSENWAAASNIDQAMNYWTGDSEHLGTMLSPTLQDIGAGVASDGNMNYYVIDCGLASGSSISPSSVVTVIVVNGTPATQDQTIAIAIVSTPDEKGNVYHEVQPGQTLWQIALAYKTTIDQIKRQNGLSSNDIYVGQKLLIARAGTATSIPPTASATRDLSTSTPFPTVAFFTATLTAVDTPVLAAPASGPAGTGGAVFAIAVVALVAAGLVAWVGRSRPV